MSTYTPSIERVQDLYSWAYAWRTQDDAGDTDLSHLRETQRAEFIRALAAHDAEVRRATLTEIAQQAEATNLPPQSVLDEYIEAALTAHDAVARRVALADAAKVASQAADDTSKGIAEWIADAIRALDPEANRG